MRHFIGFGEFAYFVNLFKPINIILSSSPFNLRCLNNFVDCCIVAIAVAAAARLDLINADQREQLIVELEELSLAGTDAPASNGTDADAQNDGADNKHNHRDDAANDSSMDGLRRMGRWLHRFDALEDMDVDDCLAKLVEMNKLNADTI